MIKRLIVVVISIMFFSSGIFAQNIKPTDVVSINPVTKIKQTKNGTEVTINFVLNIKNTWHINANKPNDNSLTPTMLKIDTSSFYAVQNIIYPPAEMVKLQFSENELALYEQEAIIKVVINVEKSYKKKNIEIIGSLQYQPCNDQTCLFPVSKPYKVAVKLKR